MGPVLAENFEWMSDSLDLIKEIDPNLAHQTALAIQSRVEQGPSNKQLVLDITDMVISALELAANKAHQMEQNK